MKKGILMKDAIKAYKRIEAQLSCKLLITGSVAVDILMHGDRIETVNDLDLIAVMPSNDDMLFLARISNVMPINGVGSLPAIHESDNAVIIREKSEMEAKYRFEVGELGVDIFVQQGGTDVPIAVNVGGIWVRVNSVMNVVRARARHGRSKDYKSSISLIKSIADVVSS